MNAELTAELVKLAWLLLDNVIVLVKQWANEKGMTPTEFDSLIDNFKKGLSERLAAQSSEEKAIFTSATTPPIP
jgi:hypothetical protein